MDLLTVYSKVNQKKENKRSRNVSKIVFNYLLLQILHRNHVLSFLILPWLLSAKATMWENQTPATLQWRNTDSSSEKNHFSLLHPQIGNKYTWEILGIIKYLAHRFAIITDYPKNTDETTKVSDKTQPK